MGAARKSKLVRVYYELPPALVPAVEAAAARTGASVNAWVVRALARAAGVKVAAPKRGRPAKVAPLPDAAPPAKKGRTT